MLKFVTYYIIFGLVGWILDTAYRSFEDKKFAPGTFLPFFSIIYGAGGTILLLIFTFIPVDFVGHIIIGGVAMTVLELFGGLLCRHVLKRDLWDYSSHKMNYHGYIDAFHTICWFILTAIFRALFPYFPL